MGKGNWKCKVSVSTSDNTDTSMKIKASCVWDSNDWSYNMNGITGWVYINGNEYEVYSGSIDCSSGNTKTLGSKTVTINKTHSSQSIPCYAKIKSTSSYSSGTETSGTTNKTVSAKTSYTVSYNANGGSGAPGNQTKWYSEDLNLSSTIPTRPGYTFNGWNTNSSGTGTNYSSGAKYTSNAALTLYAKWTINTYTVSYNANGGSSTPSTQSKNYGASINVAGEITRTGYTFNGWSGSDGVYYSAGASFSGNYNLTLTARWTINTYTISYNANSGSGAPGNQTKTYGQNLILSSTIPTRPGYNFKGWATSQNEAVAYQPGSTYTNNSGATLWAVWELAYVKPRITNFNAYRCDSDGLPDESGTYIKVEADWETDKPIGQSVSGSGLKIYWGTSESYSTVNIIYNLPTTHNSINKIIGGGNVSPETSYYVQIYVNDVTGYNETAKYPIPAVSYPIDIKKYGRGVAFGGVAKDDNVMDVNFKARFNQGQKMWETSNNSTAGQWHYLGQVKIDNQGDYAHFKIFGGEGQNCRTDQNLLMDITMKKGWQSTPSTTGYVGVTYNIYKMNNSKYNTSDIQVKVMCSTIGFADVYVYFSWAYSTIRYTVDGQFDSFIRGSISQSTSAPSEGVEQSCIGGIIPLEYNGYLDVTKGLKIPKNGGAGFGITNSDGASIIRDHNNQNVTVDATGGTLFLGYQDTTSLNILNGKAFVESGGKFVSKNGDVAFSHTHSSTNRTFAFGVGAGGDNRGIYDNYHNRWIFYHNDAGGTYIQSSGATWTFANDGQMWVNGNINFNGEQFLRGYSNGGYFNLIRAGNTGMCCIGDSNHATGIWGSYAIFMTNYIRFNGFGSGVNAITGSGNILYLGNGSDASGKSTYLRGNQVRIYSHTSNAVYLGSSGTTQVTSDEKLKDISDIDNRYIDFYNNLKPILYKYTTPTSDRSTHVGFGARQVEKALHNAGLTNKEFSGLTRDTDVNIDEDEWGEKGGKHFDVLYSLGYDEFIALNTMMIQKTIKENNELKLKMAALEQRLVALENNQGGKT